jgi:hypoxanthine-guanine phosphoribosyltransferase
MRLRSSGCARTRAARAACAEVELWLTAGGGRAHVQRVKELAAQITRDYEGLRFCASPRCAWLVVLGWAVGRQLRGCLRAGKQVLMVGLLSGAFMFVADLLR